SGYRSGAMRRTSLLAACAAALTVALPACGTRPTGGAPAGASTDTVAPEPSFDVRGSGSPDGALRPEPSFDIRGSGSPDGALRPEPPVAPPSSGARIEDERNTIAVFREVAASTVFVTQKRLVLDRFYGTAVEVPAGSGSGFIWDTEGHVV